DGLIEAVAGAGNNRYLDGNVNNAGTVHSAAGAAFFVRNGTFAHTAGAVTGDGYLEFDNVTFNHTGGTVTAANAVGTTLSVADTATGPAQFIFYGNNTLSGTTGPGHALTLETNFTYNTVLTVAAGTVNRGAIRLDSTRGDRYSQIVVASGGTLTNAAGGLIEALPGAGNN